MLPGWVALLLFFYVSRVCFFVAASVYGGGMASEGMEALSLAGTSGVFFVVWLGVEVYVFVCLSRVF